MLELEAICAAICVTGKFCLKQVFYKYYTFIQLCCTEG